MTALISSDGYFQPKVRPSSQMLKQIAMMNNPSPTGEPQLNHEPHERQYFMASSCCLASRKRLSSLDITNSVYVNEDPFRWLSVTAMPIAERRRMGLT